MAKPKKVAEQAKAAEELHQQIYAVDTEKPTDEELNEDAPPPDTEAEVKVEVEDVTDPNVPGPTAEELALDAQLPEWEQKYRSLQGKYDAEVPRLHDENSALHQQLADMQQVLASLNTEKPANVPVEKGEPLLKQEEIEDFGEDLIDVVRRAAREELSPEIHRLEAENEQLRNNLGEMSQGMAKTAKTNIFRQLDVMVPNWKQMNENKEFLDWLTVRDVYSGATRQDLLSQAFEAGDAARVAEFFRGYTNEQTVVETGAQSGGGAASPLETLVAPGQPMATGAAGAKPQGHMWTQAQIAAFYSDVTAGKFKGRMDEKNRIERDIVDATNTGRIIG